MFNVEWGGYRGVPAGWQKREPEEVKARIEELAHTKFQDVEDAVKVPLAAAKELHREIIIHLAPLHQLSEVNRERQLLSELEKFDWHDSAHN